MSQPLEIKNLRVGFPNKVLCEINTKLHPGQLTALIGRNGTGKSTLIRTIAGLISPLGGGVYYQGQNLNECKPLELARLVSLVLTARPPVQGISVQAVLEMGRYPHQMLNVDHERDQALVMHFAEKLGILRLLEQSLEKLSDGEMQKVMIAKAFIQETPIILLDEPTAFLDYIAKDEVFELLSKTAHELNKIVLFSSHDLNLIERFANEKIQLS